MRSVRAKYARHTLDLQLEPHATVGQLRAALAGRLDTHPAALLMLSAGRKLSDDGATLENALGAGTVMLLHHHATPQPRLTIIDGRHERVAEAVELHAGATVAEVISLARRELRFPDSIRGAALFSAHLSIQLEPDRLISSYDLPSISSAYLMVLPNANVAPRVSSRLSIGARCVSQSSPLVAYPSRRVKVWTPPAATFAQPDPLKSSAPAALMGSSFGMDAHSRQEQQASHSFPVTRLQRSRSRISCAALQSSGLGYTRVHGNEGKNCTDIAGRKPSTCLEA